MPLDPRSLAIFEDTAIEFERMFVQGMDDVITGGLADMRSQFLVALSLYVLAYGFLTMWQKVDAHGFAWAGARALIVGAMLNATNYNYYVRDFFFTDLPNRWAFAMGGPRSSINSAAQFDALWSAALKAVSTVLMAASHWTEFMDRALAWAHAGAMLVALILMFIVWLCARAFMAIVICIGPFVLLTFLFAWTRNIGLAWVGKLVGLTALQLSSSILMRIVLVVVHGRMLKLQERGGGSNALGTGVDTMMAMLAGIDGVYWMGALLMICLPAAIAIGSGVGAGAAAASARVTGTATGIARAPMRLLRT